MVGQLHAPPAEGSGVLSESPPLIRERRGKGNEKGNSGSNRVVPLERVG